MGNPTRQQIIDTTSELLEVQGYYGTGLNQIIKESGAPRGSLYYYFPDGKEELAAEAIAQKGRSMAEHTRFVLNGIEDPVEAIYTFILRLAAYAQNTDYCGGAPLAAVALETSPTSERLRKTCQQAYDQLHHPFEQKLLEGGYPAGRAARLALLIVATIEGTIILSRTQRDAAPLEQVAEELKTLLQEARPAGS